MLQHSQNLGQRFGTSKMHLSPQWFWLLSVLRWWFCCCWFVVDSLLIIMGFCNCSMFCCALLCVHSSFAIISMGKTELVALLCLSSGVSWLLCGSSSRCHGFNCSLWLWYFLIILTSYSSWCQNWRKWKLSHVQIRIFVNVNCIYFITYQFHYMFWVLKTFSLWRLF